MLTKNKKYAIISISDTHGWRNRQHAMVLKTIGRNTVRVRSPFHAPNTNKILKEVVLLLESFPQSAGIYDILYECDHRANDGHKLYRVKCKYCGFETDARISNIESTKKCTHLNMIGNYRSFNTFIFKNKKLLKVLHDMKTRCYNPNDKSYRWYGAKGVKVCDEWINNPISFEEWALSNGYQEGSTIDRINPEKDYCPENCRWISLEDNAKWKSTTSRIEVNGIIDSGRGWSKRLGYGVNYINTYIRKHGIDDTIIFIQKNLENPIDNLQDL